MKEMKEMEEMEEMEEIDNIYLEFLTEEETYEDQLFFDLDFDPKFNPGFLLSYEDIDDFFEEIE